MDDKRRKEEREKRKVGWLKKGRKMGNRKDGRNGRWLAGWKTKRKEKIKPF